MQYRKHRKHNYFRIRRHFSIYLFMEWRCYNFKPYRSNGRYLYCNCFRCPFLYRNNFCNCQFARNRQQYNNRKHDCSGSCCDNLFRSFRFGFL